MPVALSMATLVIGIVVGAWGAAGTIGLAFIGIAAALDVPLGMAAGAIVGFIAFAVYAGVSPKNGHAVLEETLRQLELLRREGVSEKEFREAKNQLRGSYLLGLESPGGRMQSMGRGQLHLGQCMTPEDTIAKIEAVTQADVNAVAERIFAAEPCLSVVGKNASVYLAR